MVFNGNKFSQEKWIMLQSCEASIDVVLLFRLWKVKSAINPLEPTFIQAVLSCCYWWRTKLLLTRRQEANDCDKINSQWRISSGEIWMHTSCLVLWSEDIHWMCVCVWCTRAWKACFSYTDKAALCDSNLTLLSWHNTHTRISGLHTCEELHWLNP